MVYFFTSENSALLKLSDTVCAKDCDHSLTSTIYSQSQAQIIHNYFCCRYIFGPMNLTVCRFNYFFKLVLTTQAMLFLDGIIITRYVLIFLVKNPAAIQDEFWSCYVNLWVYMFSWLTQIVFHLILGTDSNHIYLCTGQQPPSDTNLSQNLSFNNVIRILTVLIHVSVVVKIQVSTFEYVF